MLIDVHAHIDYEQFDFDRSEIIKKAKSEDIIIINSGLNIEGGKKTLDLSREFDNVYAALGLPPTEIMDEDVNKSSNSSRITRKKLSQSARLGWITTG